MRRLFAGIDLGTQSLKVSLVALDPARTLSGSSQPIPMVPGLPPGHSEQRPQDWVTALRAALRETLAKHRVAPEQVAAIGVSGQQHGLVPLDEKGQVLRPAKLWNDVSTTAQCARIVERTGGVAAYRELTGNALPPGFTAGKILWLKEVEPAHFARLRHVLLPHDYLNFYLTGRQAMEPGDASGTGLYELRAGRWARPVLDAIDERLHACLPELLPAGSILGPVRPEVAAELGLSEQTLVASGGGDNMMAAVGTGCVAAGRATVSLGTSGTVFAYSPTAVVDPQGEIAAFRDSTGGFLPLGCIQNCTVTTEAVRGMLGLPMAGFLRLAEQAPPGSDGLVLLPYLTGERTPDLPRGQGVWFGLTPKTMTTAHLCRAAIEGTSFALHHLQRRLLALGVRLDDLRATGGGSNSRLWCQTLADLFQCPVTVAGDEAAGVGAALHAAWSLDKRLDLRELATAVGTPGPRVTPDATRGAPLAAAWERYESARAALTPIFR